MEAKKGRETCRGLFFFFNLKKIFIYLCLHWFFAAGLPLVAASRGYSLVVMHALLIAVASLVAGHQL